MAICGSTRKNSVNSRLLFTLKDLFSEKFDIRIYERLAELPFFNPDLEESNLPEAVSQFRDEIEKTDGVLICTPEYVFSIPGILKNAIEWTVSTVVFTDKPVAIITASSSGTMAYESLIHVMRTVGAKIEDDAAVLIQAPKTKVDSDGKIINGKTRDDIHRLMESFLKSISSSKVNHL